MYQTVAFKIHYCIIYWSMFTTGGATIPLNISNITELVVPSMATKWFEMGLQLGVDPKELSYIESDTPSSKTACIKMFTEWLSNSKIEKTWEKLLAALSSRSVRENTLADNLRDKIKAKNKPIDGGIVQRKSPVAKGKWFWVSIICYG